MRDLNMTGKVTFLFSSRFLVTVMCLWSVTNMMYLRINMSVAIVCMVNESYTESTARCGNGNASADSYDNTTAHRDCDHKLLEDGSLKWDTLTQGQVLGSYYYGYAISKVPTGWALVRHVSGKNLILASSVASTLISLLTPIVALHSAVASVCLRVLLGICGGAICPAVQSILKNWSPLSERSRMGAYTFAGFPCGTLAAFTFSGLLCESGFAGGWPSVFYTFGACSLVFCLLWLLVVSETPQEHLCIRRSERDYIRASLGGTTSDKNPQPVPWRRILTSPPVYAVFACGVSTDFVGTVFLSYLPTYLADVMNFNIASSGLLSALPFVFCFVTLSLGGHVSDYLVKNTQLGTGTVRKLTSGSGMVMCIVSLICLSFLDSGQAHVAVVLLVVSVSGIGLMTIGYFVNPLDIAPEHAGVIVTIASIGGDISSFISPAAVAAITAQGSVQKSWQIVFLISAGVMAVCLVVYIACASGDVQAWDHNSPEEGKQILANNEILVDKPSISSTKPLDVRDEESGGSREALLQR